MKAFAKKKTPKERKTPRISLSKLGEYLTAAPLRREKIIRDQKFPQAFIVARYEEAASTITTYLISEKRKNSFLKNTIDILMRRKTATTWEVDRNQSCAQALESFDSCEHLVELPDNIQFKELSEDRYLKISQVDVSVRPEVIFKWKIKNQMYIGGLKLYFSKSNPIDEEAAAYASTIMKEFLTEIAEEGDKVDLKHCYILDVFEQKIYTPPKSHKTKWKHITAGCAEIASRWESLR